jgi:hypothetical protein
MKRMTEWFDSQRSTRELWLKRTRALLERFDSQRMLPVCDHRLGAMNSETVVKQCLKLSESSSDRRM